MNLAKPRILILLVFMAIASAITGKHILTRIHTGLEPSDNEAYAFLRNGSSDSTFLRENGISIIYTRVYGGLPKGNTDYGSDNPDLVGLAKNIYLLKENE